MSRLTLMETTTDAIVKMVDGNPGATVVITGLLKNAETIDPDHAFGQLAPLIMLDSMGIYGPAIWVLYKDWCKSDLTITYAALRARNLGLISFHAGQLDGRMNPPPFDVDTLVAKVQERLPDFAKAAPVAVAD